MTTTLSLPRLRSTSGTIPEGLIDHAAGLTDDQEREIRGVIRDLAVDDPDRVHAWRWFLACEIAQGRTYGGPLQEAAARITAELYPTGTEWRAVDIDDLCTAIGPNPYRFPGPLVTRLPWSQVTALWHEACTECVTEPRPDNATTDDLRLHINYVWHAVFYWLSEIHRLTAVVHESAPLTEAEELDNLTARLDAIPEPKTESPRKRATKTPELAAAKVLPHIVWTPTNYDALEI